MAFIKNESGAVTVDWVVLTAALVGLGLATMSVVSQGVENTSGDVAAELARDDIIITSFETAPVRDWAPFYQEGLWISGFNARPYTLEEHASSGEQILAMSDEDLQFLIDEINNTVPKFRTDLQLVQLQMMTYEQEQRAL